MAYGIDVRNGSNHLMISSDVRSLHFKRKATYISTPLTGLTNFPSYSGDDGQVTLSGRHLHVYQVSGISAGVTPMFFIKPSNYDYFHGILNVIETSSGFWSIYVLQSGPTSSPPEIYVFTVAQDVLASDRASGTLGTHGIAVYNQNSQLMFDSRRGPLAVVAANSVQPPNYPCDGGYPGATSTSWNDTNLDFNFKSDNSYYSYTTDYSGFSRGDLMFSAPSIAQAVYSRQKNGFKRSCGFFDCQDHYSTAVWWAMYHQAYRLTSDQKVHAGWCVYAAGYQFTSSWESDGWFNWNSGGNIQTGDRPFNDVTINLSPNTIIIANASHYV